MARVQSALSTHQLHTAANIKSKYSKKQENRKQHYPYGNCGLKNPGNDAKGRKNTPFRIATSAAAFQRQFTMQREGAAHHGAAPAIISFRASTAIIFRTIRRKTSYLQTLNRFADGASHAHQPLRFARARSRIRTKCGESTEALLPKKEKRPPLFFSPPQISIRCGRTRN